MATVKDKLEVRIHAVRERANRIIELAEEYSLVGSPDYGHVGDLVHVDDELSELIQFLETGER